MGRGPQAFVTLAALLRRVRRAPDTSEAAEGAPRSAARTHVGRVRRINEDRVLDRAERRLWAVADGMGGMSAGDVAAATAVATLDRVAHVSEEAVRAAMAEANAAILAQGGGRSGSTIVAAHVDGGEACVFWAGDSRAYHVRGGEVARLTRDHSLVQDLVDRGLLDEAGAESHPRANVVTRALGVAESVAVETVRVALEPGDRLLLCSDGVSRSLVLSDLAACVPIGALADDLLAAALDRDGSDNASLVLIEV